MRKIKIPSLPAALLCGAALLAFGCNRGEESRAGQVATPSAPTRIAQTQTQTPAPAPTAIPAPAAEPRVNELQTPPQSVQALPPTPKRAAGHHVPAVRPAPAPAPAPVAETVRPEPPQAVEPAVEAPVSAPEPAP